MTREENPTMREQREFPCFVKQEGQCRQIIITGKVLQDSHKDANFVVWIN